MDQFQRLREILVSSQEADADQFEDTVFQRFIAMYNAILHNDQSVGPQDIACLLRYILRREDERQNGITQTMKVPSGDPWPTPEQYQRCGITTFSDDGQWRVIQANRWLPKWIPPEEVNLIEKPLLLGEQRLGSHSVRGDPFLQEMNLTDYRSPGQREAVRAVLSAPPGSTLVVNLPTGSGKSLCAQLPALLKSKSSPGVTVVVVPTVALCIDQEKAMTPFVEHPTAYFGGDELGVKARKEGIRQRIRDGSQRIVFTAPESMHRSLRESLYQAAQRGHLRMLVIDEAHIVDQWGDEFRPDFQELSGLRKRLLSYCPSNPFVTLLLSATITANALDTLKILFGQPGPFAMVSGVQLRPEPSYWLFPCEDEEMRTIRVIEAVNNLPRPLILYTAKKDAAREWESTLKHTGYRRVRLLHGDTSTDERIEIVRQWRDREIDMVIATSAFGMGVDQADVRVVLHACVPENIDRYYQEVGRGGRDGKASLAMMFYTEQDLKVAKGLNTRKIITIDRGLQRWTSMFDKKEALGDGIYRIPINVPPSFEEGDIDMDNSYNASWNVRTLILMARSGLIELDAQPSLMQKESDLFSDIEKGNNLIEPYEAMNNYRVIKILDERHLQKRVWEENVETSRIRTNEFTNQGNRLIEEVLRQASEPVKCLADIFKQVYTIQRGSNEIIGGGVHVSKSCGGCPYCRARGTKPYAGVLPSSRPFWSNTDGGSTQLRKLLRNELLLGVFYQTQDSDRLHPESRKIENLITWLLVQGVRNIVAPVDKLQAWSKLIHNVPDTYCFCFEKFEPLFMPAYPTLIFVDRCQGVDPRYYQIKSAPLPRILLLPIDIDDPERPGIPLIENFPINKMLLQELCMEVGI